jgi:hypothetical protein
MFGRNVVASRVYAQYAHPHKSVHNFERERKRKKRGKNLCIARGVASLGQGYEGQ